MNFQTIVTFSTNTFLFSRGSSPPPILFFTLFATFVNWSKLLKIYSKNGPKVEKNWFSDNFRFLETAAGSSNEVSLPSSNFLTFLFLFPSSKQLRSLLLTICKSRKICERSAWWRWEGEVPTFPRIYVSIHIYSRKCGDYFHTFFIWVWICF